jgi:hypothetical protein
MNGARRLAGLSRQAAGPLPVSRERRLAVRGLGTRIVEMPPGGGKAPGWALRYFLGLNALPMIVASKWPVSPVIA